MENWEQKFIAAQTPDINDLKGEYRVKMLTGGFFLKTLMNFLGDCKIFKREAGVVVGYNLLSGFVSWGKFFIEEKICPDTKKESLLINYDVPSNIFSKNIRDYIREIGEGEYLGRFGIAVGEKYKFKAYFSLTKDSNK